LDIFGQSFVRHFRHRLQTLGSNCTAPERSHDTLIATSCIEKGLVFLYSDQDFDPFELAQDKPLNS
jgi:hypothetical protein